MKTHQKVILGIGATAIVAAVVASMVMTLTTGDLSSSADAGACSSASVDPDETIPADPTVAWITNHLGLVVGVVLGVVCIALIVGGFLLYRARRNGLAWVVERARHLVQTHQAANFDKGLEMALEKLSPAQVDAALKQLDKQSRGLKTVDSVIAGLNSNKEFIEVRNQLLKEAAENGSVYASDLGNVPLDKNAVEERLRRNSGFFRSSLEDIVWKGEGLLDFRDAFPLFDPSSKSGAAGGGGGTGKERKAADENDVNVERLKRMTELDIANRKAAQSEAFSHQAELLERLDTIVYNALKDSSSQVDRLRRDDNLGALVRGLKQRKLRAEQDKAKKD